MQFKQLED